MISSGKAVLLGPPSRRPSLPFITHFSWQSGPDLGPDVADLVTLKEEDHTLHASLGYQVLEDLDSACFESAGWTQCSRCDALGVLVDL